MNPAQNLKKEDIYTFLSSLSSAVFKDAVCGDGVCDFPMEYAGFGRFGCIKDCGMAKNISQGMMTISDPAVPPGQEKMAQPIYQIAQGYNALPGKTWRPCVKPRNPVLTAILFRAQSFGGTCISLG